MTTKWRILVSICLMLASVTLGSNLAIVRGQQSVRTSATPVVISDVTITQDAQHMAIRVEGAGLLDVHPTRLQNPERLVLDFTGARLKAQKSSIPAVSESVRGVRLGQFRPDVARVVIDLTTPTPYQITHESDAVVVYLQVQSDGTYTGVGTPAPPSERTSSQIAQATATSKPTNLGNTTKDANAGYASPSGPARLSFASDSTKTGVQQAQTTNNVPQVTQRETGSLESSPNLSHSNGWIKDGGDFSRNPSAKKLPTGAILVKGAWSAASDSVTPVPEGGSVSNGVYNNAYFRLRYTVSAGWVQNYSGPPPSDSGYYVLAQIRPAEASQQAARGSVLITAQDLFFTLTPSTNALELIQYTNDNLEPDYKVEMPPTGVQYANHSFIRFDYGSPVADLHWHVLTTQIRCHAVQFIFTSHDAKVAEDLIRGMNSIVLSDAASPAGATNDGDAPACIKNYASDQNVFERVDPILTDGKFNSIPVRIIIDKEGKVKHIHFLSAFPEQEKAITDALSQWRLKPYLRDGRAVEVETGIMFGRVPHSLTRAQTTSVTE
jgi:hypothetical protein